MTPLVGVRARLAAADWTSMVSVKQHAHPSNHRCRNTAHILEMTMLVQCLLQGCWTVGQFSLLDSYHSHLQTKGSAHYFI